MTIEVDKAIVTRWDNKSLDNTVTGGLHHGLKPERTSMPYASFSTISDVTTGKTHTARYGLKTIQISVWDVTDVLVGSHIEAIKNGFVHSDRALTNPLRSPVADEIVKNIEPLGNPIIVQESRNVWQAEITLEIMYAEDRNLIPA